MQTTNNTLIIGEYSKSGRGRRNFYKLNVKYNAEANPHSFKLNDISIEFQGLNLIEDLYVGDKFYVQEEDGSLLMNGRIFSTLSKQAATSSYQSVVFAVQLDLTMQALINLARPVADRDSIV